MQTGDYARCMEKTQIALENAAQRPVVDPSRAMASPPPERLAVTPAEFAKSCGKHPVWAYRQIYAGRLRVLGNCGRMLIPVSEIEKFLSQTIIYNGRPERSPRARRKVPGAGNG